MKFIGQYIQDFIARFRSDVYLENIDSGTIASGGSLGLDSNNKIVKASASAAPDADATTKGIVELATTAETTTGTDATRAVTPDGLKDGFQGSTNIVAVGTITSGAWRGIAIDQTYLVGQSGTNTGDQTTVSGNAGTATKLETTRALQVTLSETDSANFDGSAAVTDIGVTGTLAVGNGGTGLTSISTLLNSNVTSVSGNAGTATALATARDINGVSFDGTGDITVTAAGSTLSDTVTVAKGGTGATSLTSNSILTGNGTSAVQAESGLTYNSEILNVGDDDNGDASIRRTKHSDEAGGQFEIRGGDAGGTDKAGGNMKVMAGRGTGSAAGGNVQIWAGGASGGGSSSSNVSNVQCATFKTDQSTILLGNLIFEGASPDAHETTFSITDPTDDRTITVPDADVDLTKVRAASDTLDGVVELATTAEADTGTDTSRAITAAGLKSHVDKRYSYQYLTWEVNTASFTSTNYEWPASNGGFGSEEFTTNTSIARNTSIVDGHADTPTYSAAKNLQHMGWYVPHACQLVGVSGAFRNNGGLTTPRDVAVFVGTPDIGSTATPTYTQRAFAAGDVDGGQANSRTYTTNVTLATSTLR